MSARQCFSHSIWCDFSPIQAAILLALLLACEDAQPPTATRSPTQARTSAASEATPSGVTAQNINLPVDQSVATSPPALAFRIIQTGTGADGQFSITNRSNASTALYASTNGSGTALAATTSGLGSAGSFQVRNSSNISPAVFIGNSGNLSQALKVSNLGIGWAGLFLAQHGGNGVSIVTNGGVGLEVVGGSKQAVVPTTDGARSLYTEESSEVWFTDYGFGRLQNGRARILIDPIFAQTVNLEQPYQVFVQAYGDAELYVKERTSLGFEVVFRGGNDRQAEFGYRIVAKRRGFETARLEPAADELPGLEALPNR